LTGRVRRSNVAVQTNIAFGLTEIAERVVEKFDHEPELKARHRPSPIGGRR